MAAQLHIVTRGSAMSRAALDSAIGQVLPRRRSRGRQHPTAPAPYTDGVGEIVASTCFLAVTYGAGSHRAFLADGVRPLTLLVHSLPAVCRWSSVYLEDGYARACVRHLTGDELLRWASTCVLEAAGL